MKCGTVQCKVLFGGVHCERRYTVRGWKVLCGEVKCGLSLSLPLIHYSAHFLTLSLTHTLQHTLPFSLSLSLILSFSLFLFFFLSFFLSLLNSFIHSFIHSFCIYKVKQFFLNLIKMILSNYLPIFLFSLAEEFD